MLLINKVMGSMVKVAPEIGGFDPRKSIGLIQTKRGNMGVGYAKHDFIDGVTSAISGGQVIRISGNIVHQVAVTEGFNTTEMRELPPVTPPFERTWIEGERLVHDASGKFPYCAALITRMECDGEIKREIEEFGTFDYIKDIDEIRWVVHVAGVYDLDTEYPLLATSFAFVLGHDGRILTKDETVMTILANPKFYKQADEEMRHSIWQIASLYLYWTTRALGLLNCKNVELNENHIPPKLIKKHEKRGRAVPATRFHTLTIKPMGKKSKGHQDGSHQKPAFHHRRGHWRDYTEAGLFGRWHGWYYWNDQWVGSVTSGSVEKTYQLGEE